VGLRAPVAGAVAALLALLILAAALATGDRGARLATFAGDAALGATRAIAATGQFLRGDLEDLGWNVADIRLRGATPAARGEILTAAAVRPGQSLTALDLAAVRARVETVGWVESARAIRLLPNTLEIAVVQRPLMALWQHGGRTVVVASNGAVENEADPSRFPALPLIVGEGANTAAAALLPDLVGRPALMAKVSALVRVDDRRWNLDLRDGGVVMLPADDPEAALKRLDALETRARILQLGLQRIDLRDPDMVVVRPRGAVAATAPVKGDVVDGTD
jgi:cell division protein FtsQ